MIGVVVGRLNILCVILTPVQPGMVLDLNLSLQYGIIFSSCCRKDYFFKNLFYF